MRSINSRRVFFILIRPARAIDKEKEVPKGQIRDVNKQSLATFFRFTEVKTIAYFTAKARSHLLTSLGAAVHGKQMAKKPSYIGTLTAIANAERGGYELFKAWASSTRDSRLRTALNTVAVREAEHSWAFEKRLGELGYPLEPVKDKGANEIVKLAASRSADTKKFHALGIGVKRSTNSDNQGDRLLSLLSDTTIDSKTGELLGRFICEERDSGRLLTEAYKSLQRRIRYKRKHTT